MRRLIYIFELQLSFPRPESDKKLHLEFNMWHSVGPMKANDTKVKPSICLCDACAARLSCVSFMHCLIVCGAKSGTECG